jgi:hypothetical protein
MSEMVRLGDGQGLGGEAEGATDRLGSGVAGSEDVYVRVADHDGLGGMDRLACKGGSFRDEGEKAMGIGLFCMKAVAAVVLEKEAGESKVAADIA